MDDIIWRAAIEKRKHWRTGALAAIKIGIHRRRKLTTMRCDAARRDAMRCDATGRDAMPSEKA